MTVSKLNRKSLRHEVYIKLLDYILTGTIHANSRIDENDLANKLGISRTPLREAINRLIQEGLVIEVPYVGNFVREFNKEEVEQIYEVRAVLEAKAVKLAVQNMNEDATSALYEIVKEIKVQQKKGNVINATKLDDEFHMYLANQSGNVTLMRLIKQLEKQIQMVKVMGNRNMEVASQADTDREKIMEAILKKDAELAASYMERHILNACKGVIATFFS